MAFKRPSDEKDLSPLEIPYPSKRLGWAKEMDLKTGG